MLNTAKTRRDLELTGDLSCMKIKDPGNLVIGKNLYLRPGFIMVRHYASGGLESIFVFRTNDSGVVFYPDGGSTKFFKGYLLVSVFTIIKIYKDLLEFLEREPFYRVRQQCLMNTLFYFYFKKASI